MSDLDKALEWWWADEYDPYESDHLEVAFDAARKWANLTSPENVEKAGSLALDKYWQYRREHDVTDSQDYLECFKYVVEAVLRAVDEGTE
jgi:hypothetical protein